MKKSYPVNISGVIFQVDEDAYEKLNRYLDRLQLHFATTDGREEIIADIEQRIAEMLIARLGDQNRVVNLAAIEEIIRTLGEPADIDDTVGEPGKSERQYRKRLYRDPDDKVLGGIAGGMGAYFNTDPLWFRIAFIVATLLSAGFGFILYLILWVIVPEAKTTAEKLEMRGEEININNIERSIREEMNDIRNRFSKWNREGARKKKDKAGSVIESTGQVFVTLFALFFKFIAGVIGFAIILTGIALLLAILVPGFSLHGFPLFQDVSLYEFFFAFTGNEATAWLILIAVALIVLLPLLGFLWAGLRLLFRIRERNKTLSISMSGLWFLAILFCVVLSISTINDFSNKGLDTKRTEIAMAPTDTLTIGINPNTMTEWIDEEIEEGYSFSAKVSYNYHDNTRTIIGSPVIEFKQSATDTPYINLSKRSRGKDHKTASQRAASIRYTVQQDGKTLLLDPVFTTGSNDVYRQQEVKVNIYLPEGTIFRLDRNLQERHAWIRNFDPLWDESMPAKLLTIKDGKVISAE